MIHTVLDSVALGYQPIWSRTRQLAAVRLVVHTVDPKNIDGAHLLRAMGNDWPKSSPLLVLAPESESIVADLLELPPLPNTWLEVPGHWFEDPEHLARITEGIKNGHRYLRHAALFAVRGEVITPMDVRSLLHLSAEDALEALKARPEPGQMVRLPTPIIRGQIYAGVASQALANHCLDEAGAWGLLDWPEDDVLHHNREHAPGCNQLVIDQIRRILNKDTAWDRVERLIRQDPVMMYRLLLMVNSAAYGLSREIWSLRHALMMLGADAFGQWLMQQQRGATNDMDMHPVRYAAVMRARLAQHLLDTGADHHLRADVYLAAMFSQVDLFLHEPLVTALHKLPLSGRVFDAALRQTGAYNAYVDTARAQGRVGQLAELPAICDSHDFSLDHANRGLLRMLQTSRDYVHERAVAVS